MCARRPRAPRPRSRRETFVSSVGESYSIRRSLSASACERVFDRCDDPREHAPHRLCTEEIMTRTIVLLVSVAACSHRASGQHCDGASCGGANDAVVADVPSPPGPGAFPLWVEPSLSLVLQS